MKATPLLLNLLVWVPVSAQPSNVPLSICSVIREAGRFEGRVVAIRGILQDSSAGAEDVRFDELVADNCPGWDGEQIRIQVVSPDAHFLANPPRGYRPNMASIRRAERFYEKLLRDRGTTRRIWATVEGVLYLPKQDPLAVGSAGKPSHREYTAYLVVQAIRELSAR